MKRGPNRSVARGVARAGPGRRGLQLPTTTMTPRSRRRRHGGDGARARRSTPRTAPPIPRQEIEGDTIKLVSSYPQSGLTAAFSEIARGWKAYFEKVNADGGVDIGGKTYKIEYRGQGRRVQRAEDSAEHRGDGRSRTASGAFGDLQRRRHGQQHRHPRLPRRAVRARTCSPPPARRRGATPTTRGLIGSTLAPYTLEGQMFDQTCSRTRSPTPRSPCWCRTTTSVGPTRRASSRRSRAPTSGRQGGAVRDRRQRGRLARSPASRPAGADAFFNGGTLLACPDALTKAEAAGWKPITWVSATCTSKTLMGLAGTAGGTTACSA